MKGLGTFLQCTYLWLVGNGRMVEIVVIIVPHSSIPYEPKVSVLGGLWDLVSQVLSRL